VWVTTHAQHLTFIINQRDCVVACLCHSDLSVAIVTVHTITSVTKMTVTMVHTKTVVMFVTAVVGGSCQTYCLRLGTKNWYAGDHNHLNTNKECLAMLKCYHHLWNKRDVRLFKWLSGFCLGQKMNVQVTASIVTSTTKKVVLYWNTFSTCG